MPIEIVLPLTSPESEWVRGRAVAKMSPTRDHARLQTELVVALVPWSRGRGEVGTEWRFRLAPPGEERRPLVPDIAFVASEQLRGLAREELQAPDFAPAVAIEILSPGDARADVESKIEVYLRSGTQLVVIVDPVRRRMQLHDGLAAPTDLTRDDVLTHPAMPGFSLSLAKLFATALDLFHLS